MINITIKCHQLTLLYCFIRVHDQNGYENGSLFQAAAAFVEKEYGGLDLLINSAGMLHPSGRGETSLKDVTFQVRSDIMFTYHAI